jgi:hypothetical protein
MRPNTVEVARKKLLAMFGLFLAVLCLGIPGGPGSAALGQEARKPEPRPNSTPEASADTQDVNQQASIRAIDVLRSVAEDARQWKDLSVAASVQAQVADLTWDADAGVARGYLLRAWETAAGVEELKQERSRFRNYSVRVDARREVILVARKRDPELAQKWLEQMSSEEEANQGKQDHGVFDDRTSRSAVLLQMAISSVADNPKAAASLATESLQDGVSFGFQNVLVALQEKDFELAQGVFRAALARLRARGTADPDELLILHAYLYTPGRVFGANTSEDRSSSPLAVGRNQPRVAAAAELNPALAIEFLKLAADLLLSAPLPANAGSPQTAARAQISSINFLLGKIAKYFPEQATMLQAKMQQLVADARFSPTSATPQADYATPQPGESKEDYAERRQELLEEAAEKETDNLGRDIAYGKASLATAVEQYDRGIKLAEHIRDESLRKDIKNWLTYRATLNLIKSGDLNKAYELNLKNGDAAQRAASLVVGAQRLVKAKDTLRAGQWLQEARLLVEKAEPDENSSRIALGTVSAYGEFDKQAALDSLSVAVRLMGRQSVTLKEEEKAPLIKRFSGLAPLADFTYGTGGFSLKAAVSKFAPEQFESVLGTLNKIESPEARGLAAITLCRNYLHLQPPKSTKLSKPELKL